MTPIKKLALILLASLILYSLSIQHGFFSPDEREYYYLSKSLAEKQSLYSTAYFPAFSLTQSEVALPAFFSFNGFGVYPDMVETKFMYPLLASVFYWIFGFCGLQFFNIIVTLLTTVLVYFMAWKIFDETVAVFSSLVYSFCTFSVFYSTSLWYHTLATMFFLLCQVVILYFDVLKRHVAIPVLIVSSVFCVWTAYYMFLPLAALYVPLFYRRSTPVRLGDKAILLLLFFLSVYFVWPASFVKAQAGDLIAGSTESVSVLGRFLSYFKAFVSMFFFRWVTPDAYSGLQKSLLESCPYMVAFIPGLFAVRKISVELKSILLSHILLVLMVVHTRGHAGDFGAWTLNMRYLLSVLPLLVVVSSAFLSKHLKFERLFPTLVVSSFLFYILPVFYFSTAYNLLLASSWCLILFFIILCFLSIRKLNSQNYNLTVILFLMLIVSNILNINDVKFGNQFRHNIASLSNDVLSLVEDDSVLLVSRSYDLLMFENQTVLYYPDDTVDPVRVITEVLPQVKEKPIYMLIPPTYVCDEDEKWCSTGEKILQQYSHQMIASESSFILYKLNPT